MDNNLFEFSVRDKFYIYDGNRGEIFDSDNFISESGNYCEDDQKDLIIRKHVPISEEEWKSGKVLNKIALSIAHTCNMSCTYCFADGGTYGAKKVMSKETAKDSIDYFFRYASRSAPKYNIHFMGGEPLTNLDVFYFAVDYINNRAQEFGIPIRYTVSTNGTIMNENILEYIIKNNMHINFSIDGNQNIHDLNRKYINGNGSFRQVINTLEFIENHNYYNMTARMTVTKPGIRYLRSDIEYLWGLGFYYIFFDLVKTDIKELAVDDIDIHELGKQLTKLINSDLYLAMIKEGRYVRNFSDKEYLIEKKITRRECSYYNTNMLQVTPEGDLYKCPYTVGEKEHKCGNIYSGLEWEKYKGKFKILEACYSCWAKRICGGGCGIDRDISRCSQNRIIIECALKHYVMNKNSCNALI